MKTNEHAAGCDLEPDEKWIHTCGIMTNRHCIFSAASGSINSIFSLDT